MKAPFPIPYCLNVHPAADWRATKRALDVHALAVKKLVAPDRPFPLSLHLGYRTALELANPRRRAAFRGLSGASARHSWQSLAPTTNAAYTRLLFLSA